MWALRLLAVCWLLFAGLCSGSVLEFQRLDVSSPHFDVDAGWSGGERWQRLSSAASVPLKGWNSYDGWDWSVTERDMIGNMDYLAANLSRFGYSIAVVDYYWYLDLDASTMYLDGYGRLQPDTNRFPASADGAGFKKLAAYAHSKGLLFGIHTSRPHATLAHARSMRRRAALLLRHSSEPALIPLSAAPLTLWRCGVVL